MKKKRKLTVTIVDEDTGRTVTTVLQLNRENVLIDCAILLACTANLVKEEILEKE